MLNVRLLVIFLASLFASMPIMAGFSNAVRRAAVASFHKSATTSLLTKSPLHLFGDVDRLKNRLDGACAFKENLRDGGIKPLYANQDGAAIGDLRGNGFFGIFDGHGKKGGVISAFAGETLIRQVLLTKQPSQSLKQAFAELQSMLKKNADAQHAGTTAVVGLLEENNLLTVANVGDSRLIVVRNKEVLFSTRDHKPTDPIEEARIKKNGGFVRAGRAWDPITGTGFALSRSMGDICVQGTALIAEPDIESVQLHKGDFVVLASDGVWDVLSNEHVTKLVYEGGTLQEIADRIVAEARAEKSLDDITALVFCIK